MRRYALLLLPLGAGLGLAALWRAGVWPNVILYLRADVATLFLLLSVTGGVVGAVGLMVWSQARARREQAVAVSRQEQADSHRRFIRRLSLERFEGRAQRWERYPAALRCVDCHRNARRRDCAVIT